MLWPWFGITRLFPGWGLTLSTRVNCELNQPLKTVQCHPNPKQTWHLASTSRTLLPLLLPSLLRINSLPSLLPMYSKDQSRSSSRLIKGKKSYLCCSCTKMPHEITSHSPKKLCIKLSDWSIAVFANLSKNRVPLSCNITVKQRGLSNSSLTFISFLTVTPEAAFTIEDTQSHCANRSLQTSWYTLLQKQFSFFSQKRPRGLQWAFQQLLHWHLLPFTLLKYRCDTRKEVDFITRGFG